MKKQMARISAFLALVVILSACGSSPQSSSTGKEPMTSQAESMQSSDKMETMGEDKMAATKQDNSGMGAVKKEIENPAPAFVFTDFEGNSVALSDFEGKQVHIKFWASWCSICLKSMPETDELSAMEKDFEVITVVAPGVGGEKNAEDFQKWYQGLGYENITVLFDENGTYMREFGVRAFPSSAHINADGSLIGVSVGHSSNDKIKAVFEKASGM